MSRENRRAIRADQMGRARHAVLECLCLVHPEGLSGTALVDMVCQTRPDRSMVESLRRGDLYRSIDALHREGRIELSGNGVHARYSARTTATGGPSAPGLDLASLEARLDRAISRSIVHEAGLRELLGSLRRVATAPGGADGALVREREEIITGIVQLRLRATDQGRELLDRVIIMVRQRGAPSTEEGRESA